MLKRITQISVMMLMIVISSASADVLWDQSDYDVASAGFFNAISGAPPFGMTVYSVSHITVDGAGWDVDAISVYFSALDPAWGDGITQGSLHIFDKTSTLPVDGVDDPVLSITVPMSGVFDSDHIRVTASGLGLSLDPGEYWIGITPEAVSGPFGPEVHLPSQTYIGDATASYDPNAFPGPPAWNNMNPGVDAAMMIEGSAVLENVLWNQSDYDAFSAGFFNAISGAPPFGMTVYSVSHITVDGTGWDIDTITAYFSALDAAWGDGITQGSLHVFDKIGSLPIDGTDDPAVSVLVSMSGSLNGDHIKVVATGLNLVLDPGEYWIGITPEAVSGPFGPEVHLPSLTLIGDATASYDPNAFPGPPAWYNMNPGVDAAMLIQGTLVPGPTPTPDPTPTQTPPPDVPATGPVGLTVLILALGLLVAKRK